MRGLEDERLVGMTALALGWVIDEHARQFPAIRPQGLLSLYLDEVQIVAGWEPLVHRLVESRDVEIIVSGGRARRNASPSARTCVTRTWGTCRTRS